MLKRSHLQLCVRMRPACCPSPPTPLQLCACCPRAALVLLPPCSCAHAKSQPARRRPHRTPAHHRTLLSGAPQTAGPADPDGAAGSEELEVDDSHDEL